MKSAVRQILLSSISIKPSSFSRYPQIPSWTPINAVPSADGTITEAAGLTRQALLTTTATPALSNGASYRFTVWAKGLNRKFIGFGIQPNAAASRFFTVFGLSGEGLIQTAQNNADITLLATSYQGLGRGIYRLSHDVTLNSGASNQFGIIAMYDVGFPAWNGVFDYNMVGSTLPAMQILGIELLPL